MTDWNETLQNMATIAELFTVNPEYQEAVAQLKKDVAKYEELCGIYKDKVVLDRDRQELEKQKKVIDNLQANTQEAADKITDERNGIRHEIRVRTDSAVAELKKDLEEKIQGNANIAEGLASDRSELDRLLNSAKKEHKNKQDELDQREAEIRANEKDSERHKRENIAESARLKEISDKFAQMV